MMAVDLQSTIWGKQCCKTAVLLTQLGVSHLAGDLTKLGLCAEEEGDRHLHGALTGQHRTFRRMQRLRFIRSSYFATQASS